MKKLLLTIFLMTASICSFSQEFNLPDYQIQSPKDCDKYNNDVLNAIDWLISTPPNKELKKQQKTKEFLIQWMTETKAVSIYLDTDIVNFFEKNEDLLIIFMCGSTKYALKNNVKSDKLEMSIAGIELCIDYYNKNINLLKKDKNLEKYIKMKNNGTLRGHLEKVIK
ncbi:MAG: hypothetical protein WC984_01200 [Bacteroidales bacterium]